MVEIVKIENGYYEVRVGSRIISYHSSQWGAEQVAKKIAQPYEAPRLTRYGDTAELFGNRTN